MKTGLPAFLTHKRPSALTAQPMAVFLSCADQYAPYHMMYNPSAFSTADFMHGPIASTEPGFPCFVVQPKGRTFDAVGEVVDALEQRGAELIVVSDDPAAVARGRVGFAIPDMPEECSPMAAAIIGQLLALHIALEKRLDPDHPRGLSKVTLTL